MADSNACSIPLEDRRRIVAAISPETELHKVLAHLMKSLGALWVDVTHGSREQGKDLVLQLPSKIGPPETLAVTVKLGQLSGAAGGSRNLREVKEQVEQAFSVKYPSATLKRELEMDRVLVVCTGKISNNAKEQIVSGRHTHTKNVNFWDLDTLVARITDEMPEFFSRLNPAEKSYLDCLHTDLVDLTADFQRFGPIGTKTLHEVFVEPDLWLISNQAKVKRQGKLGKTKLVTKDDEEIERTTPAGLIAHGGSVLVMGGAGSGKSLILRKCAADLAQKRGGGDQSAPLPLWVDTSRILVEEKLNLKTLHRYIRAPSGSPFSLEQLAETLTSQRTILFIDAIDELGAQARQHPIVRLVSEITKAYPKARAIMSTRRVYLTPPAGLDWLNRAFILPWGLRKAVELLEKILGKGEKTVSLLRSLVETEIAQGLPKTPLVYTILAILHDQMDAGEIPATLADLYRMLVEVSLGKWTPQASQRQAYSIRFAVLQRIAVDLHEHRRRSMPVSTAREIATAYVLPRSGDAGEAEEVLDWLVDHSNLLEVKDDLLSFGHLSFQEFLVADSLFRDRAQLPSVQSRFADEWWANVLTFYAGIAKDVPDLIESIVATATPDDPVQSLRVGLNLGPLLQAAKETPRHSLEVGVEWGTRLTGDFYSSVEEALRTGRLRFPFPVSKFQLFLGTALLHGSAYSSSYLSGANQEVAKRILKDYADAEPQSTERTEAGVAALSLSISMLQLEDWTVMKRFIELSKPADLPLLQAAAEVIEQLEPESPQDVPEQFRKSQQAALREWKDVARTLRHLAPKDTRKVIESLNKPIAKRRSGVAKLPLVPRDEFDDIRCNIAGCSKPPGGDGLCRPHHHEAREAGRLADLTT